MNNRRIICMEIPIGAVDRGRNTYYDPVTAAVVISGVAAGAGAVEAKKSRKQAKAQAVKAETQAKEAQDKQESLALEEKAASDKKLAEQRQRVLRGAGGRSQLLFGSDLGVQSQDTDKKTTLGA